MLILTSLLYFLLFSSSYCNEFNPVELEDFNSLVNIKELSIKIKHGIDENNHEREIIALLMLDASSKIITGLFGGNAFDLGHFDECYNIESGDIFGKYCLGTFGYTSASNKYINTLQQNITHLGKFEPQPRLIGVSDYMGLHFAACIPSSMKAEEIPGLFTYKEEFCYSKATEPDLSTGAIVTIVILAIFLAIIVASTIFDTYLYYTDSESPHELLIAFSFLSNGRKLFSNSKNPDQILCLNGIKALSMMWVIIGHVYMHTTKAAIYNIMSLKDWQEKSYSMFIKGADVSVDTFFLVGGLVTVYTFLKSRDKGVKFNVLLYYVHRYLRLTPALGILILVHLYLLEYVATGPLWKVVDLTLIQTCKEGWWSTLLYISNYTNRLCLPQTWYLAVDMQLFLLSPIILLLLTKWPKIGLSALGFLTVAGVVVPFSIVYGENIGSKYTDSENYMQLYYSQTYTRFGPYVIGMIVGYMIYLVKRTSWRPKLPPKIKIFAICATWLVLLTGLLACVFAGFDLSLPMAPQDRWANSLYAAFNRPAWAVAVGGVIMLCVLGYGGPVNTFLSLPIFQILTKLSYSMYLVHFAVIVVRLASLKTEFKFSDLMMMHTFWGDFMVTLFLSLLLCLSFESPIIIIEKYMFGGGIGSKKQRIVEKKREV